MLVLADVYKYPLQYALAHGGYSNAYVAPGGYRGGQTSQKTWRFGFFNHSRLIGRDSIRDYIEGSV
jgi:hypothetical protein